ncbi:MAG: hypothetical protein FWG98_04675 [Candidatus Cloacimonetes bacterium]|nr:hypothetical protein [Candidatus Cloacimonadota bacterium]
MAIDRINNDLQSRNIMQNRVNEATSGKKENVKPNEVKKANLEDSVFFSQDAKRLQEIEVILQNALHQLKEMDEINRSNLIGIQEKIDKDFYSNREVAGKVIDEIFPEAALRKTIEVRMKAEKYVPELTKLDTENNLDWAKIDQIKTKVENGYYNSREVIESIADGLIDLLEF